MTPDGTVLVGWIDTRHGPGGTATYVAGVAERGTRLDRVVHLNGGETCVCCRVSIVAGRVGPPPCCGARSSRATYATWSARAPPTPDARSRPWRARARRPLEDHRLSASRWPGDERRAQAPLRRLVHRGAGDRPEVLLAAVPDGRRFGPPRRVHTSTGSVPDRARLAMDAAGRGVVVWEDSTAARRRILLRSVEDGGRSLGPVRVLSQAIKAWAPASPSCRFLVAWHEEQFPATKTVVVRLTGSKEERR